MSFDSFQTSGNSPGRDNQPHRFAILDRRARLGRRVLGGRSPSHTKQHKSLAGAGLQAGPTFAEAV